MQTQQKQQSQQTAQQIEYPGALDDLATSAYELESHLRHISAQFPDLSKDARMATVCANLIAVSTLGLMVQNDQEFHPRPDVSEGGNQTGAIIAVQDVLDHQQRVAALAPKNPFTSPLVAMIDSAVGQVTVYTDRIAP